MGNNFKVGDIVEAWGVRGVVERIDPRNVYCIIVVFQSKYNQNYSLASDGRFEGWHKEPSLKLVSRPKNKVKKTFEGWINMYDNSQFAAHETKELADKHSMSGRVACFKVISEYEVEE